MQRQGWRAFLSLLFIASLPIASAWAQQPTFAANAPSSGAADPGADRQTSLVSAQLSDARMQPVAGEPDTTDPNSMSAILARLKRVQDEIAAARADLGTPPDDDGSVS